MIKNQIRRQIKSVTCPYNPAHIMPQSSLLNHLSKCSATNKHLFTKCRYNPLHVYPNQLIDDHYRKCKNKAQFDKNKPESSDNWDSDSDTKAKPQIKQKTKNQINQSLGLNQSIIRQKSKDKSEKWQQSDQQDLVVLTNKKMEKVSINQSKLNKTNNKQNDKKRQKQIYQFAQDQGSSYSYIYEKQKSRCAQSSYDQKIQKNKIKKKQKSEQKQQELLRDDSSDFHYEDDEYDFKKEQSKKGNQTSKSVLELQKSRDNSKQINKSNNISSHPQQQNDIDTQDF